MINNKKEGKLVTICIRRIKYNINNYINMNMNYNIKIINLIHCTKSHYIIQIHNKNDSKQYNQYHSLMKIKNEPKYIQKLIYYYFQYYNKYNYHIQNKKYVKTYIYIKNDQTIHQIKHITTSSTTKMINNTSKTIVITNNIIYNINHLPSYLNKQQININNKLEKNEVESIYLKSPKIDKVYKIIYSSHLNYKINPKSKNKFVCKVIYTKLKYYHG